MEYVKADVKELTSGYWTAYTWTKTEKMDILWWDRENKCCYTFLAV